MGVQAGAVLQTLLAGLAEAPEALADRLAHAVLAAVPELPPDLRDETVAACGALAAVAVAGLREGGGPDADGVALPEAVAVLVQDAVERGLPLEVVLAVGRAWHGAFARCWLEVLHAEVTDRERLAARTARGSAWLFAYVDAVAAALAAQHAAERERWARSALVVRRAQVDAVLAGAEHLDAAQAGARLRYRLEQRHLGFVVWPAAPAGGAGTDALLAAADAVADAVGAVARLRLPGGPRVVHAWVAVSDPAPDPLAASAALTGALAAAGVAVAFGEADAGVPGFRVTHEQALSAQRVAQLGPCPAGTRVRFDDVSLVALMTQDPRESERFLARELGPLRAPTPAMRRLAETARVYLEEGASHVAAGRRLGVHENTVGYRVRRASELLGCRVEGGGLRLHAALQLHAALAPEI